MGDVQVLRPIVGGSGVPAAEGRNRTRNGTESREEKGQTEEYLSV